MPRRPKWAPLAESVSEAGYRYDRSALAALGAMLASYLGHLRGAQCWSLWQQIWHEFDFLARYFGFDAARGRLVRRFEVPAGLPRVRTQYRYLRWRFPECALFFPVGRFCECYEPSPPQWVVALGLTRLRANRRGASFGFPLRHRERHRATLLARGIPVLDCAEQPRAGGGIHERVPLLRHERVEGSQ